MVKLKNNLKIFIFLGMLLVFVVNACIWYIGTNKYVTEDIIKERLIGTTFIDENNSDICVIITESNLISLEYTQKVEINSAFVSDGLFYNIVEFEIMATSGGQLYSISGILKLGYYKGDGRRWCCEQLYAEGYETHHVNWVTFSSY